MTDSPRTYQESSPFPPQPGHTASSDDDTLLRGAQRPRATSRRAERSARTSGVTGGRARTPLLRRGLLLLGALLLLGWTLIPMIRIGPTGYTAPVALLVVTLAGGVALASPAALALGTVAGRRRAWESVALCVAAGLAPWMYLVPYAVDDQPSPLGRVDAPLHVLLVNANQGRASAQDIASAVTANAVDVLVVTELSGTLAHDLTAAGLARQLKAAWVALPGEGGAPASREAGTGVWSRVPVTATEPVPGTQWPAGRVTATVAGAPLTIVSGHVDSPQHSVGHWALDLSLLRDAAATGPGAQLVIANLNATVWNADLRAFGHAGLRDASEVAGGAPRPTWPTWAPLPLLPLDHVMVSHEVGVQAVDTVVISGSDHRALLVGLTVPRAEVG